MPLQLSGFSRFSAFTDTSRFPDLVELRDPTFDWGFDAHLPYERLSIFARHIDTAAPITRLPVFALAEFDLDPASREQLDMGAETGLGFAKIPLGVIGTDHVGYGSFDLWPLRRLEVFQSLQDSLKAAYLIPNGGARVTVTLSRLLVLPFKDPAIAFDALKEGDLGPDFLTLRMNLDDAMLDSREPWPPMPAMQSPGIVDWRLSPGSFSMAGALLIGEDGCETLLPSNLSTRMVRFRQLVRTQAASKAIFGPEGTEWPHAPGFSGPVRLGYAVQYNSEWFPLGHSLGQISYSLPLAPGEKIKIAVVDWSRRDAAKRTEQTTEKEDLDHAAVRDRSLSEAVHMVVRESQSGSSFMAGGALSAGAGIPIGPVSLGAGAALGAGGAQASSRGMREIVGDTTQQISDAFHQASSAMRELNSTVIVQADQAEKAEARTRIVANYNHSHALTILYYEVLQHYRILTRPAVVRPVLFLKHTPWTFDALGEDEAYELIEQHYMAISASLLDASLRDCLGVVQKLLCYRQNFKPPPTLLPTDDFILTQFLLKITTGASAAKRYVTAQLILKDGDPIPCLLLHAGAGPFSPPNLEKNLNWTGMGVHANFEDWFHLVLERPVRWGNIAKLELWQGTPPDVTSWTGAGEDPWDITHIHACANAEPLYWVMANGAPPFSPLPHNGTMQIPVQRYVPGPNSPEEMLTDDERCCLRRLIGHLNDHRGHYWRAIWLTETATDRAVRLEDWTLDGNPVEDVIDNVLLDFVGEWAVLPVAAGAEEALAPIFDLESLATPQLPYNEYVEQMLTLPARGVFAEAKLGHCNASEIIDYDRFWDWQSSPIPDDAPAIEPASTESRYQDPTKGLAATPFPAAMVNIVNPQALPDPTGLNAAAGVLSSLGAFRDMSGLKELGPYLQTLSNNATQLASQGMKNAQMPALINAIRGAKELPEPERARLIGELLGGQVKPIALPAPAPAATPKKPAGTGSPPPEPTQATKPPAPEPAPAPKPIPAPKPQRSPSLSDKTRLLVFTFAFETGDVMMGRWTVELLSGGDSRRESRAINTVGAVSGVDIGNRIEMYIEDSFGGDSDVSVHIHGAIVGLPQVLSVGTRTYEMKTWSEARDFTNDIPRTTFNKTRTVRVVQGTEPVDYKIQRSITDTTAETKVSQTSAGLEVGVENAVEVGGSVPGIAEGKEAVKVHAKGTLGWMGSTTGLVQGTNGWSEEVTFKGYRIKPSAPTITPL